MLCRDEMEEWSSSEANLFEEALEKYGKDFNDIRQDFVSMHRKLGWGKNSFTDTSFLFQMILNPSKKILKDTEFFFLTIYNFDLVIASKFDK